MSGSAGHCACLGVAVKKCSVCVSGLTETLSQPRNLHVCGDGGSNVCSGSENSGLDSGQESSA